MKWPRPAPSARDRRCPPAAYLLACIAAGVIAAALIVPMAFSNATTTAASTTYKTATNETAASAAASSDAPGGEKIGSAKPGDTLKWVVSYTNKTSANATVTLTDLLTNAGAYVPGSLEVPPLANPKGTSTPRYTTNGGGAWSSGTPPANANGVGLDGTLVPSGTRQLSSEFVAPPTAALTFNGGDAYNIALHGDLIYGIGHHQTGAVVSCSRYDGTTCPGWPTSSNWQAWSSVVGTPIGSGTKWTGFTAMQVGAWVGGDRLYWYAGTADGSSQGVACLDLSTTTPRSCGYAARTGSVTRASGFGAQIGGTAIPAVDGNLYAAASSNGALVLVCTTPSGASCPDITLGATGWKSHGYYSAAVYGDYVFASAQRTTADAWSTFCYDLRLKRICNGSLSFWPVSSSPAAVFTGTPFAPILSKTGTVTGVCTFTNGTGTSSTCWNLAGTKLAPDQNPYAGTGASISVGGHAAGDALVIGTKVYLSAGNQVMCRDFAAYSGTGTVAACAGFVPVSNAYNYTTRTASIIAPDCLVATGDAGVVSFFHASTGGKCAQTSSKPQEVTVTPSSFYCGSGAAAFTGWDALRITGLTSSAYRNALVTLRDQNGNAIRGFDAVTVTAGGSLDLSSVPTTVTSITATVTLQGVTAPGSLPSAQVDIAWVGAPVQVCFRTTAPAVACDAAAPLTLSNTAKAVTTSSAGTDAPGGNSTGAVKFLVKADASQCSLEITKTSGKQSARPGHKVDYTITVKNTGSQAYEKASFSDDLTDLLKDASYNNDQVTTAGTVTYAQPMLSWTAALARGAAATITYSVTVRNPATGDQELLNTVVSTSPRTNCSPASGDPRCTVKVPIEVSDLVWRKVDSTSAANILAGSAWTLTPLDSKGNPTGPALPIADCMVSGSSGCAGADIDSLGGAFRITGLGPGTYRLVETRAPAGFQLATAPITLTIADSSKTVTLSNIRNTQVPVPPLPFTGGLSSDALTLGGSGLLGGAAILLLLRFVRRRRATLRQ